MVRSTSVLGLSRDLWYKLGGILLVALVIAGIAYSLASASQAAVPPTAETFANKKCAADEADAHGCYPGKGEGWCAARGACINRMDAGLADDVAFAKQCALDDTTTTDATAATASTASTKTVTEVDTTVTTKAVETDTVVAETATATAGERTDATGGACCLGDSGKAADDKGVTKCPASASTAPAGDCATCGDTPPSNCPKPVYCPPCPKCPPPCPRMCPDLSKYVLKTSIPPCPEAQVDLTKYMLKSDCKQPDMSKYVLKTSVPSFKCPPCPPCICKCDGSAYDPAVDGDGKVAREEAEGSANDAVSAKDAVSAEEALGGNRDASQSSADFDNADLTGASAGASNGGASGDSDSGYDGNGSGGFGSLGGSAFGFGGGLLGRSSNGGGGVGANSATADFEGACAASDNDAYNGSYSVQPVIQD